MFTGPRSAYRLNLVSGGTEVVDVQTGRRSVVPFGEQMRFAGEIKYSKNIRDSLRYVGSHLEGYGEWQRFVDVPVDFLRTGAYWSFIGAPQSWGPDQLNGRPPILPDRADKVIVAYINATEYTAIGRWDPSFDPAWDRDGDAIIDSGVAGLPSYVETKVFNADWKGYVAAYWTASWRDQLVRKIDAVAAEHFDGIMLDVMTGYKTWQSAFPEMDPRKLRGDMADLFRWISEYSKQRHGTAFAVTANLDPAAYEYFSEMGRSIDAGYYQNALFEWNGSGRMNGYGRSTSTDRFVNPAIQFVRDEGLAVLDMEHLGTGPVTPGLDFVNYDDRITRENLLALIRWAIASGSTPYCSPVFFDTPYRHVPRFVRLYPGRGANTSTSQADWVIGSGEQDHVATGAGDDLIYGGGGDDQVDGGEGTNIALYLGPRSRFVVDSRADALYVTDQAGVEGTDRLRNIHMLQFDDGTTAVSVVRQGARLP